jgi:polysaccharide biosynthesis/export protein
MRGVARVDRGRAISERQNEMKLLPLIPAFLATVVLAMAAHADVAASEVDKAETAEVNTPGSYRIQPGDVLVISVWKEPDLQMEVLVRPDGGLSFPLAGDQHAAGRTVDQLRQSIATRLKKFVPDPVVTVTVRQLGGNRVYVIGKVNRPGEFPFSRPLDVMQSLSIAGGATSFASLNDIRILRRGENGKQISIPFRYEEVARGRNLEQNVQLESGDTVVVP